MNPTERIRAHLAALYGPETGGQTAARVDALIAQYRQAVTPAVSVPPEKVRGRLPLTQRDALLITYADQLRRPGEAPLRTLARFAEQHLRGVVSGIHLLPFYPWGSDDGFGVKDYHAVDPAVGDWAAVRDLGRSFDLMFDAVLNHLSAQGDWFQRFAAGDPDYADFFLTVEGDPDLTAVVRPRTLPLLTEFPTAGGPRRVWTTFSADQVDLNYHHPAVLLAVLAVLLFYVRQGARYLRLDAIAFLWKEVGTSCLHRPQTHRIVQCLRAVLDAAAPDVMLITETNVPHADNVSYFGDGRNEAQLVYNFALPPLVLHAFTQENAEALARWARSLHLPSDHVTFFNFLASHDGIGLNPARGVLPESAILALADRARAHGGFVSDKSNPDGSRSPYELNLAYFDALSDPRADEPRAVTVNRFLCAHAILLSFQGVPGLYFHSLIGSRGDREGAQTSGIPRRINREKLDGAVLEEALADPTSRRAQVFKGLRHLLACRRAHPAFHPLATQEVVSAPAGVLAYWRRPAEGTRPVFCAHNVSGRPLTCQVPLEPEQGAGRDLLTGDRFPATAGRMLAIDLGPWHWRWVEVGGRPAQDV